MINLQLTVREALWILSKCETYDSTYDKIVAAVEEALSENKERKVTITGGMSANNRISCIKAVRAATGMGLKEAMNWCDSAFLFNGRDNISLTLSTPEAAERLLRELTTLGFD